MMTSKSEKSPPEKPSDDSRSSTSKHDTDDDDEEIDASSGERLKLLDEVQVELEERRDCSEEQTTCLDSKSDSLSAKSESVNKPRNQYKKRERHRSVVSTFNAVRYKKYSVSSDDDSVSGSVWDVFTGGGDGRTKFVDNKKFVDKKKSFRKSEQLFDIDDEIWHDDRDFSYAQKNLSWFIKTFTPLSVKKDCVEFADFVKVGRRNTVRFNLQFTK